MSLDTLGLSESNPLTLAVYPLIYFTQEISFRPRHVDVLVSPSHREYNARIVEDIDEGTISDMVVFAG